MNDNNSSSAVRFAVPSEFIGQEVFVVYHEFAPDGKGGVRPLAEKGVLLAVLDGALHLNAPGQEQFVVPMHEIRSLRVPAAVQAPSGIILQGPGGR